MEDHIGLSHLRVLRDFYSSYNNRGGELNTKVFQDVESLET